MKSLGVGGNDLPEFAGACLVLGGMKTSIWRDYYTGGQRSEYGLGRYENGEDDAVKKAMAHIDALDALGLVEEQMVEDPYSDPEIELTEELLDSIPHDNQVDHSRFGN